MEKPVETMRSFWSVKNCLPCLVALFLVAAAGWLFAYYLTSSPAWAGAYPRLWLAAAVVASAAATVLAVSVLVPSVTNALWRRVVFFVGDIKRLGSFPWFTWAHDSYLIDFADILKALPVIEYGDIGLHRSKGFLSNLFIPGFMKHAWIHVQDGVERPEIVEALSEGVLLRNAIHPIFSDYTIVLTPVEEAKVTDEHRKGACLKAKQLAKAGVSYDPHFNFNIEEELKYFTGLDEGAARDALEVGKEQIRFYDIAFSCTEVVAYAWWHRRESLGIERRKRLGKSVILADSFLNPKWKIKWASPGVTPELARRMHVPEEGVKLIEEYWQRVAYDREPPSGPQVRKMQARV